MTEPSGPTVLAVDDEAGILRNPIVNSPVTSSPALVIPADEALCSLPTLTKSSGSYDIASDTATWTVTIANTSANAISREVVVTDSGATLTAVSGGSCTGTLPDTDGTFNCTVAGGGTLTLTVCLTGIGRSPFPRERARALGRTQKLGGS